MSKSRSTILNAAKQCFFQHGYSAANVSMISRYADISRVTIHKQFGSKEEIFRHVVEIHCNADIEVAQPYIEKNGNAWDILTTILKAWANPIFTEINDDITRNDLLYAGRKHCEDIIEKHRINHTKVISDVLNHGFNNKQLSLTRLNLNIDDLAKLIEANFSGFIQSTQVLNIDLLIEQNIAIYRAATTVDKQ